jgi:GNAT superfamily N-acetyltransferase
MQLSIGPAGLGDVPEIMRLMTACMLHMRSQGIGQWDEAYPTTEIVEADANSRSLFVARVGKAVVGTVCLNDTQPDQYKGLAWRDKTGRAIVVRRLCVSPTEQRRGLGSELLQFAEKFAKENGYDSVRLDAYTGNPRAQQLYDRNGFHRVGQAEFRNRPLPFDCFEKVVK